MNHICTKPHWGYGPVSYSPGSPCPVCGAYRAGQTVERAAIVAWLRTMDMSEHGLAKLIEADRHHGGRE